MVGDTDVAEGADDTEETPPMESPLGSEDGTDDGDIGDEGRGRGETGSGGMRDEDRADMATGAAFFGGHDEGDNDAGGCPVDDEELQKRGLSRDDAMFLQRVLDAMNRELPNYTLLEEMTG